MISVTEGFKILVGASPFKKCQMKLGDDYTLVLRQKTFSKSGVKKHVSLLFGDKKVDFVLNPYSDEKIVDHRKMSIGVYNDCIIKICWKNTQIFNCEFSDIEIFEKLKNGVININSSEEPNKTLAEDKKIQTEIFQRMKLENHIFMQNFVVFDDGFIYNLNPNTAYNAQFVGGAGGIVQQTRITKEKLIYYDYISFAFIQDGKIEITDRKLEVISIFEDGLDLPLETYKDEITIEFTNETKTFSKEFVESFHSPLIISQIENGGNIYLPISSEKFSPDNIEVMNYLDSTKLVSCMIRHFMKIPVAKYVIL